MGSNPCEVNGDQSASDRIADQYAARMRALCDDLLRGLTLDGWHSQMMLAIREAYLEQAIAGAPDLDERAITSRDLQRIENDISKQYQYLDKFAADIETAIIKPGASLAFIPNRASLYALSSGAEYWKQAVSIDLPAVPRDGSTQCGIRCQCGWELECAENGIVRATWILGEADHCVDCVRRSQEWSPLIINTRKRVAKAS